MITTLSFYINLTDPAFPSSEGEDLESFADYMSPLPSTWSRTIGHGNRAAGDSGGGGHGVVILGEDSTYELAESRTQRFGLPELEQLFLWELERALIWQFLSPPGFHSRLVRKVVSFLTPVVEFGIQLYQLADHVGKWPMVLGEFGKDLTHKLDQQSKTFKKFEEGRGQRPAKERADELTQLLDADSRVTQLLDAVRYHLINHS